MTATDVELMMNPEKTWDAHEAVKEWRLKHNRKHTAHEHLQLAESGLTFTPYAAQRLAPYGLVPIADAQEDEISHALREAPRAPVDDVETTRR